MPRGNEQTFGSWQITGPLGAGGMGAVFAARHVLIGKRAALKRLHPEHARRPELVARFFNEARAAAAVEHPGIIAVFDYGETADGCAYIVMERLDGESLSARLRRRGRLGVADATRIARQVADALGAAHARGVVHRDVKPDHVFLIPDGSALGGERSKLLDFGIAKLAGERDPGAAALQTRTGALIGTPAYMAPEQCRGAGGVDARADLYALGCVCFEMLTGRPPFREAELGELLAAHMFAAPPGLRALAPEVPEPLEAIVLRLLAKHPAERFAGCAELAAALDELDDGGRGGRGRADRDDSGAVVEPTPPGEHLVTLASPATEAPSEAGANRLLEAPVPPGNEEIRGLAPWSGRHARCRVSGHADAPGQCSDHPARAQHRHGSGRLRSR